MATQSMARISALGMALSDSNRLRALMALREGELCVCELIELVHLAPSTVSRHMSILKQAGLVVSRKDGRWVYYRMAEEADDEFISELTALVIEYLEKDGTIRKDNAAMLKIKESRPRNRC